MSKTKTRQGGINITADELDVLVKVVESANLEWFSFIKRNYGNRKDKTAEHFYPFDRILDVKTGNMMSIREGLERIESEITDNDIECLNEREKGIYAALFERSGLKSKFLNVQYGGIFRNKGLFRRAVRWSAMDELADSFVNDEAKKLWEKEGYPIGVLKMGLVNIPNIKWFRESDKDTLTEEEFDRISEVFRKCINM